MLYMIGSKKPAKPSLVCMAESICTIRMHIELVLFPADATDWLYFHRPRYGLVSRDLGS